MNSVQWMKEHAMQNERACFSNTPQHKKDSLYDSNKVSDLTWGHLTVSWVFSRFSYNVPAPGISRQYIITWSQIFFFLSYFYIKKYKIVEKINLRIEVGVLCSFFFQYYMFQILLFTKSKSIFGWNLNKVMIKYFRGNFVFPKLRLI